jgi:hypothetical protein
MKANADKFQAIVSHRSDKEYLHLDIEGHIVISEDNVKLLGITIDDRLSFDMHVRQICRKVGQQINVLKRLAKKMDVAGKLALYKSFMLCHFNYCPIVWTFCGKGNIKIMEKLQERALRLIFNDNISSYSDLLNKSQMSTLHIHRLRGIALQVFKCINKIGPTYLHDLFQPKCIKYSLRDTSILHQKKFMTVKYGFLSFTYHGSKIWNTLPTDIKTTLTYKEFKTLLYTWEGPLCKCNHCTIVK